MFKRIDRSPAIARLLQRLSTGLARRRGLPIILGIALVAVGLVAALFQIVSPSPALQCVWAVALHGGILMALVGILLIEPLGR
jgi:membrane-associated PAP2 superfamily phosphatase